MWTAPSTNRIDYLLLGLGGKIFKAFVQVLGGRAIVHQEGRTYPLAKLVALCERPSPGKS